MKKYWCADCGKFYRPRIKFSIMEGLWFVYIPHCKHFNFIARGYTRLGAKGKWIAYFAGQAEVDDRGIIQYYM